MDYIAAEFLTLADIAPQAAGLLRAHLGSGADPAWNDLTAQHNDRAAAALAVCGALARTTVDLGSGQSSTGIAMISSLTLLSGDRIYALLDPTIFNAWRENGGRFTIARADGSLESGRVGFNRGGTGGSLHEGFDIQGITGNRDVPRIQWNYRHCDGFADIDVDGYPPWDVFHHLTYANSDPRQWYDKYVAKFGRLPFKVNRVGGVEPDEVRTTSVCPRSEDRLATADRARALETAEAFAAVLESTGDMGSALESFADSQKFEDTLRSPNASPLLGTVAPAVLETAPPEALREYYVARSNVQLNENEISDSLRMAARSSPAGAQDVTTGAASLAEPVESLDDLARAHESLRADERAGSVARAEAARISAGVRRTTRRPAAWLTTDPAAPAGARAVAVELPKVRVILVKEGNDFRVISAVPWRSPLG
jgi:hypothetical protein